MPWKGIKDPYKIWLSEIILQQTRVEQGIKYYQSLTNRYPNILSLSEANEQELFSLWQGLGYYNRCRNMHATAKKIVEDFNGIFPSNYEEIKSLKGIGDYTAAAIASFAFNLPYAVVDGNVVRIISRLFALDSDFYSTKGKKEFQVIAQSLLSKKHPDLYNQAIMDLGATICKPVKPSCSECPLKKVCKAYQSQTIELYPKKKVKLALKIRYFHFFIIENDHYLYIYQRKQTDIWQDLYSFYMIESEKLTHDLLPSCLQKIKLNQPILLEQTLSHQKIIGHFYQMPALMASEIKELHLIKIKLQDIGNYAFPRIIVSFFEKYNYL